MGANICPALVFCTFSRLWQLCDVYQQTECVTVLIAYAFGLQSRYWHA